MRLPPLLAPAVLLFLAGCHSAFMDATLRNRTAQPITLVELDYPSASFGTQTLAPGQDFHYRFKVLGAGDLKLLYTDASHTEQHTAGPRLEEGDEGSLLVTVTPAGTVWEPTLRNRSSHQ